VLPDGTTRGTIGGGAIEFRSVEAARALLADPERSSELLRVHLTHDLGMCCGGSMVVFLEKIVPGDRLLIFGAGHIGRALAGFAAELGFQVAVIDSRAEQLTAERFPRAERLLGDAEELAATLPIGGATYACVMTHDHQLDQRLVEALIRRPLVYLGMIGSLRKAERCRMQLSHKGFSDEEVARLRSPIGVHIGAQSPEEIALSIASGLVAHRHGIEVGPAKPRRAAPGTDGGERVA
jgi:xanthine dehydrogenase accessory factor